MVPGAATFTDVKIELEAHASARASRLLTRGGSVFTVIGAVKACDLFRNHPTDTNDEEFLNSKRANH
jgi:hypothetical protein